MSRQTSLLGGLVPTKAEAKEIESLTERLVFCLTAPVVACPSWSSIITKEQKEKAQLHRLAKLMKGDLSDEATDYEAMLWIHTLSLEQPLDREGYHVFTYLFRKFYPEQATEIFSDNEGVALEKYTEESLLRELKRRIFNSQREHLKNRGKGQRR